MTFVFKAVEYRSNANSSLCLDECGLGIRRRLSWLRSCPVYNYLSHTSPSEVVFVMGFRNDPMYTFAGDYVVCSCLWDPLIPTS